MDPVDPRSFTFRSEAWIFSDDPPQAVVRADGSLSPHFNTSKEVWKECVASAIHHKTPETTSLVQPERCVDWVNQAAGGPALEYALEA